MSDPAVHSVQAKDIQGVYHEVPTERLRWRPSVYAILLQDDRVLVVPADDKYDLPGGGIEFGEMPESSLIRETYEETGLEIGNVRLFQAASSFFKMPNVEDDFIQSLMLYYCADVVGGELSTDHHDEIERLHLRLAEWMPISELAGITLTSSIDWRPIVQAAHDTKR